MLTLFRRLADRLTEAAAVAVLLTLLGSVVLGVVSRAVNQPMIWSDELARYLMVWLAFIGWILASRRRAHIRITAALDRLPRLARRGVEGVIQLALAIFGLLLMRDGFILVERNLDIDAVSLPVPAALLYVPILLAGLSTILQAAAELADLAAGREPVPAPRRARMTTLMFQVGAAWLAAMAIGVPLFAAMGLAAYAFVLLGGLSSTIVPQKIAQSANSFPILAAPLFILMGNIMNSAGITERIFSFATALVGWLRGGLCHANILASVIFAGMSGSAVADAAGVGTLEIKAMRDEGYDAETAAALTAASATIGPIIPPSLPMVIYGISADVSIGALFLAGVVPGLLMAGLLMLMVAEVARRRNLPRHPFPSVRDLWIALRRAFWALMTPVVLFGGMITGHFTPTEAAAVAAVYALVLGLVVYRDFDLRDLPRIAVDTVETTGVVLALVMTAGALGWCLSISRIPQTVGPAMVEAIGHPLLFLLVVNLLLLAVGCFMEALAAMLILIPILTPAAAQLGIDPVQFGLVFVLNLMIGTVTPPVGVVLFVTSRIAGISFEAMSRAILPWLLPLLAVLAAITLWPPLTTGLPALVMGR